MRRALVVSALLVGVAIAQPQAQSGEAGGDPWTRAFTIERIDVPAGIDPQIGGIAALPDGRVAVCFHRGEVLIHDPEEGAWSRFAEGLHEPLGLLAESATSLLVMQRAELTRLSDTDGDGVADDYETVFDGFGMTGNYHEFAFGPARDADGNLYVALNLASNGAGVREEVRGKWTDIGVPRERMLNGGGQWGRVKERAGRMYSRTPLRGWVVKLSPDGSEVTPFACGFRSPDGIGFDAAGRLLVTDNQGDWLGTSKVHHVREGHFHGHPAALVWRADWDGRDPLDVPVAELETLRTPAMMLLPQGELASSPTQPLAIPDGVFGPLAGQTLIGEMNRKSLVRLLPDPVGDVSQGAAVPFLDCDAFGEGNHRMVFTDDGSLWVGKTHLSWAGAEGFVRVRWNGEQPGLFAVAGVQVVGSNAFRLRFTEPLDADAVDGVAVARHTYHYHRTYGSPKVDEAQVPVEEATLEDDGASLLLRLPELRTGYVYTFGLSNLRSRQDRALLGSTVYYTLLATR